MKKIYIVLILVAVTFVPFILVAQSEGGGSPGGGARIPNPLGGGIDSLAAFVEAVLENIVIPIGAVLVVLAVIYSGFLFVTAQGNPAKLEVAKQAFLWTAIGTIILLGALAISEAIQNTINQITS